MRYRRDWTPGATFFFTAVLRDRQPSFAVPDCVALLRSVVRAEQARRPFAINAAVILPDHLHMIWTLPDGDAAYHLRWRAIKGAFTVALPDGRRGGVWQPRYWEHRIRDDADLAHHVNCIHSNPVKHGYVNDPAAWPYSSIHRYIDATSRPSCAGA